jgi:transposase
MRVTTAFNKMLGLVGVSVATVAFTPEGIVLGLRRRRAKHRCPCGWRTWAIYDRSVRRWRHLDLGASRCFLEAEIARIHCRSCGRVRTEEVPWARPGSRHSRDFQDVVAWLAQRVDKTTITKLLRVSWEAVAKIVIDVVAEAIDDARLNDLYRIGVDEVSYRKGHSYLTLVYDIAGGTVEYIADDRKQASLDPYFESFSPEERDTIRAVVMDMWEPYVNSVKAHLNHAEEKIVFDKFHIVKHMGEALDTVRKSEHRQLRAEGIDTLTGSKYLWLYAEKNLPGKHKSTFAVLKALNLKTARAWATKESLSCCGATGDWPGRPSSTSSASSGPRTRACNRSSTSPT